MAETINKRSWQEVETDIAFMQDYQDEVSSSDEGKEVLDTLNELYEESNESFQPVRDRLTGEIEQVRVKKLGEISAADALDRAREEAARAVTEAAAKDINDTVSTAYDRFQR